MTQTHEWCVRTPHVGTIWKSAAQMKTTCILWQCVHLFAPSGFYVKSTVQSVKSGIVSEDIMADNHFDPSHSKWASSSISLTGRLQPHQLPHLIQQRTLFQMDAIVSSGFYRRSCCLWGMSQRLYRPSACLHIPLSSDIRDTSPDNPLLPLHLILPLFLFLFWWQIKLVFNMYTSVCSCDSVLNKQLASPRSYQALQ